MLYKLIIKAVGVVAVVVAVMFTGCDGNSGVDPDNPNNPNNPNNGGGGNYTYTGRTARIGSQTWMAENLNRATTNSKCYENSADSCAKYGRLYLWDDAKNACPSGWHLPSDDEWTMLTDYVGGESTAGGKLRSTSGWYSQDYFDGNGTDDYGFSALPGGVGDSVGSFGSSSIFGYWWSATEVDANWALDRYMHFNGDNAYRGVNRKTSLFSVRCVQN